MGGFPGFGVWINQNTQQPHKAQPKIPDNFENSVSEKSSNNKYPYIDRDEEKKQGKLWSAAERKHPWYDAPPRVKMTTKKGLCHMNIELTLGSSPGSVYEIFTDPLPIDIDRRGSQHLLKKISRKILQKNGPREIAETEYTVGFDFLWWSGAFPIKLIVDENQKDLTVKYKKEKMMFMKVFEVSYKVEPIYVDAERLCKRRLPKSLEEYRKCSGGQGKVASKVIMNQYFQPSPPFNLPPLSWYIRGITINTTKTLLQMFQYEDVTIREIDFSRQ